MDAVYDNSIPKPLFVRRSYGSGDQVVPREINLGYTINLHLPATSDVAVFNAIFKSLREHLLR